MTAPVAPVTQGISTHWIRHTTLTWVEPNFGYAIARAYAGGQTVTCLRLVGLPV